MVVISLTLQNLQLFFSENTSVRSQVEMFQIISKIFFFIVLPNAVNIIYQIKENVKTACFLLRFFLKYTKGHSIF